VKWEALSSGEVARKKNRRVDLAESMHKFSGILFEVTLAFFQTILGF